MKIFEYRDITSTTSTNWEKFLFKFSVKSGVSCKEYFERGWWSGRSELIEDCEERQWHGSTIGLMKFHEIAYSFPTRTAPMIWISKIACSFSPRWFLDRNFDRDRRGQGWNKAIVDFLDIGSLPLLPPRKTARNESDTRGQRSKRSASFGSAIFQFSKSNYLTIRRSKNISLKLAIRFKNGDEGNSR